MNYSKRNSLAAVAGLSFVLGTAACSSSSGSGNADAGAPANGLSGVYVTTDDGPIQQFQFVDSSHVNVWWSHCADGEACESETTYTLNGSELDMNDPLGNVTSLNVTGLQQSKTESVGDLHLQGGGASLTKGSGGAGLTEGSGASLTQGEVVALIVEFDIELILGLDPSLGGGSGEGSGKGSGKGSGSKGSGSGSGLKLCKGTQHFSASGTFPNDRTAFDYFRAKGLSAAQAAGIVGNLDQESGNDPTKYQYDDGPGRGIAQWTSGGGDGDRWDGPGSDSAEHFASTEHASVWSLRTQLDFIWYELTHDGDGLSSLKKQSSVDGAESIFQSDYERCGTCAASQRIQYAQAAYNAFVHDPVSEPSGGTCTQDYGSCSVDGEAGSCVDTAACGGSGGESTPGFCPGPNNVQCCTKHPSSGGSGSHGGSGGSTSGSSSIASLALANVGKQACSENSKGEHAFESSCTGDGGHPEYWCADFAIWVWAHAGMDTSTLTAAAGTFYCYGSNHGTLHSSPAVGDAVVFNYQGGCVADHVAIVTKVNANGTIETASGDWGGDINLPESEFAGQSHVVLNTPAYSGSRYSTPSEMGMEISGFISPVK